MYEEDVLKEIERFIDSHMNEEITLKKISDAICYSEEYTSRFFKRMTGENLFEFIRNKRLVNASEQLKKVGGKIIDVAFDSGFNSHEGFSRAFSSYFGISPIQFRKLKPEIKHFMPKGWKVYPLGHKENYMKNLTIFTQVVERPERKFLLLRGKKATHYFEYCEEVGCDIWGRLLEVENPLYEPIGVWLPKKFRKPGTSEYAQGVEVSMDYSGHIPQDLEVITLPACKYMIFQSESYKDDDKVMMEVIQSVQKAIQDYNPKLYGFDWDKEAGPRFQPAPLGERGYIEGVPVRLMK